MMNKMGEMGEPGEVPTDMGTNSRGPPLNRSLQERLVRK